MQNVLEMNVFIFYKLHYINTVYREFIPYCTFIPYREFIPYCELIPYCEFIPYCES